MDNKGSKVECRRHRATDHKRVFSKLKVAASHNGTSPGTSSTQKDSILERKFCIEHVIFWWKTPSCAETMRPRPHVNGCYSSISVYFIENWYISADVVVKYDPMF